MPLRPSDLLTERRFWNVITRSLAGTDSVGLTARRQEELIVEQLNRLTKSEFTGFIGHFSTFFHKAYRRDLWAAAFVVMGGCSNDCFMDFRTWLVLRGKTVYFAALNDPDLLLPEYDKIPKGDIPLWDYQFQNTRFGRDAFNEAYERFVFPPEQDADPEHQWSSDDPESMRRLCPRTFEAFWEKTGF